MRVRFKAGAGLAAIAMATMWAASAAANERLEDVDAATAAADLQSPQDNAPTYRGTSGSGADILVTAQRRTELLKDVPLAVQAFSGQALEEAGFRDLREIISLIPGASEGRGNAAGIRSYQIRGVSSFLGDSTIGYYLDEAAYVIPNRNYAPVARSFDIERVEVLRGPQGTLYGLGSMGGTIRFITADPDLDAFRARGNLGISDTAEGGRTNWYGDAAISVPIVPGMLAVRGVASYEHRGGFAQSPSFPGDWNDDRFQNYRVKLLARPVDALTIRLGYHRNITSDDWGQNFATTDPPRYPVSPVAGRNRQVYDMYTGFLSYDFGPVALESSTGYVDRVDRSRIPIIIGRAPAVRLDVRADSTSFVQEVRAVSQGDTAFRWVVGGIYQEAKNLEDIHVTGGPPISAVSIYDSKSWAAFGEMSYGFFGDKLRPLIGLRYFEDRRDFFSQNRPPGPVLPPPFIREAKFDSLNPRFNLSWQPTDNLNFYANVARGFRSGTFNSAAAVAASGGAVGFEVEPDNIWSYELGGKMSFPGTGLYLELSVYRLDWTGIQLNYTIAGGVQVIRNAGDVQGQGIEYVLNWRPVSGLTLQASGNFNSTEFKRIVDPARFAATPNIAVGRQVASVPKHTFNLGGTYQAPIGMAGADLFLNAQYSLTGRQGDPGDNLGRFGKSQNLLRARAGLQWDTVSVILFGENLLGENDPIWVSNSGRTRHYPRVLGVELSFNF